MGLDLVSFYPWFKKQALHPALIYPLLLMALNITSICPELELYLIEGLAKWTWAELKNTVHSVYVFQAAFTLQYSNLGSSPGTTSAGTLCLPLQLLDLAFVGWVIGWWAGWGNIYLLQGPFGFYITIYLIIKLKFYIIGWTCMQPHACIFILAYKGFWEMSLTAKDFGPPAQKRMLSNICAAQHHLPKFISISKKK